MNFRDLENEDMLEAIRSIKRVTGCREILIGGRGALVVCHGASAALRATRDFDVAITKEGDMRGMTRFSAELGMESNFAAKHGYYIEHVGEDMLTYILPDSWRERAVHLEVEGVDVLCLATVDVAMNKLNASRPKDLEHLVLMLKEGLVSEANLRQAIDTCPYVFMREKHLKALNTVLHRL